MMEHVHFGRDGERYAEAFLEKQGYDILERNYRQRFGEIDLIAHDQDTLCFIEVKTRLSQEYGHPFEALTPSKQRVIRKVAARYMLEREISGQFVRFDVVGIQHQTEGEPVIELLKNAF